MDENNDVRAAGDLPTYYDLSRLKERGWTARLVKQFLGEPDDTDRARVANTGRPKNLYCAKRVAFIESHDPQFKVVKDKAATYSGRLRQTQNTKKKNLAGVVESMTFPEIDLPWPALMGQAQGKIIEQKLGETTPERVALEILLDSMASLSWRLEMFSGYAGICEARSLLRIRIFAHLTNKYLVFSENATRYEAQLVVDS